MERVSAKSARVTPHDLRHTAASLAISSGANVKAVQRMLGHASAAMTLDTYADLFEDDLDDVATRLNEGAARRADIRSADPLRAPAVKMSRFLRLRKRRFVASRRRPRPSKLLAVHRMRARCGRELIPAWRDLKKFLVKGNNALRPEPLHNLRPGWGRKMRLRPGPRNLRSPPVPMDHDPRPQLPPLHQLQRESLPHPLQ